MPCDVWCDISDPAPYYSDTFGTVDGGASPGALHTTYSAMGWVGFLKVRNLDVDPTKSFILRLNSCDLKLSQTIETPEVIDGRIGRTVYKLGPKIVEGSLSMPLIADVSDIDSYTNGCVPPSALQGDQSVAGQLLGNIWCWATGRGPRGRILKNNVSIDVRYANHAAFTFDRALVNSLTMNIEKEQEIKMDMQLWARSRAPSGLDEVAVPANSGSTYQIDDFLSPARILTWNDATINAVTGCDTSALGAAFTAIFVSSQVRSFTMDINNNAERIYTLNGTLYPADINVKKREIGGSIALLGLSEKLRKLSETNQERFTEKNRLRIALYIGNDRYDPTTGGTFSRDWFGDNANPAAAGINGSIWYKEFAGTVFEIEEMEMTNDIYETKIKWHGLASDVPEGNNGRTYSEFSPSTSCDFPIWKA